MDSLELCRKYKQFEYMERVSSVEYTKGIVY